MTIYNTLKTEKIKILRIKYTITTSKNYKSNAGWKRQVLRLALKTASDDESLIWSGSLFQSLGTATEKALSPHALRFALGSSSNLLFEDLSVRRESLYFSESKPMW